MTSFLKKILGFHVIYMTGEIMGSKKTGLPSACDRAAAAPFEEVYFHHKPQMPFFFPQATAAGNCWCLVRGFLIVPLCNKNTTNSQTQDSGVQGDISAALMRLKNQVKLVVHEHITSQETGSLPISTMPHLEIPPCFA